MGRRRKRTEAQITPIFPERDYPKPSKRARSAFLVRHILASDDHEFVGRIYGLGIIELHFDTYDDLAKHADAKYAFEVNYDLSNLTRRVESLNMAGDLLWLSPMPKDIMEFPVSRYQWLTVAADVFLMRYISVADCALILVGTVFETGLDPHRCTIDALRKKSVPLAVMTILQEMRDDQGKLRPERNARFHHGSERAFSQDDQTLRIVSIMERWGRDVGGFDRFGRRINLERLFKEGLVELQREFNGATKRLVRQLDRLYDAVQPEFEVRFRTKFRNGGYGSQFVRRV